MVEYPPETLGGLKQNLVHTRTPKPHRDWGRPAFSVWMSPVEVLVSSGLPQGQGLWVQKPGSHSVWHKSSWRRLPLTPPWSCRADDPQTAEQLYQINCHTVKKVLGAITGFPALGSGKETDNPQGIWLWRPVGFDYRTYTGLGKQTLCHLEGTNTTLCTPGPRRNQQAPQETDPD